MRTILLTLLLTIAALTQSPAQSRDEKTLFALTNQTRVQQNLPLLSWDPALAQAARFHGAVIARAGGLAEHQYPGEPDLLTRAAQAGARFTTISENVAGNALSPGQIHQAFLRSAVHRANILDPRLNTIGIAIVSSHGTLYAVEDFARAVPTQTPISIEHEAMQFLMAQGIQPNAVPEARHDAHNSCQPEASRLVLLTQPALVIQWSGPDLKGLPAAILPHLPPNKTYTAAIGNCPASETTPGVTTYRLSVLLYEPTRSSSH